MQLGEIIATFSEEAPASEALLACNDIVLFAQVSEVAARHDETTWPNTRQARCGVLPIWLTARTGSG